MSDLISRLSLKDRASEYDLSEDEYKRFCKIIDAEPTAYSVDNVIKRLNTLKNEYEERRKNTYCRVTETDSCDSCRADHYLDARIGAVDRSIEIVKQGGLSDDVCEWRLDDDDQWHTGCRNKIDNMDNEVNTIEDYIKHTRFSYCPFCGKKIKVVE